MGSISRVVLRSPASFYCLVSIVMFIKWVMWFPIMLIRYGLSDALDAALTTPSVGRPHTEWQIGRTTIWRRMSLLWHPQTH
jgi:hypothetical protein